MTNTFPANGSPRTDYDQISRSLFDSFKNGELTRQEYYDDMNKLYAIIPASQRRNIDQRKDRRSLGEFALMIYDSTVRERFLVDAWRDSAIKKGVFEKCRLVDNGISNDGVVILSAERIDGARRSDFMGEISGKNIPMGVYPIEVKFSPTLFKLTFKCADLRNYIQQDALVLLILSSGRMMGANGDPNKTVGLDRSALNSLKWTLFGSRTMGRMLTELEVKNYRELGFKPSVQLRDSQFSDFIDIYDF